MTYEQALQIAIEELDEKIQCLSDTFNGHSARIESYIYDLSMARKALMHVMKDGVTPEVTPEVAPEVEQKWVGLNGLEQKELMAMNSRYAVFETEAKLKEKNT